MKKIYLAIPYSGMEELSFKIANRKAGELMAAGNLVFSPISHSRPIALACNLPHDSGYWQAWNRSFIELWADEVHVIVEHEGQPLPWEKSVGVQAEIDSAVEAGKPVFFIS